VLDVTLDHNRMTWSHNIGSSKAIALLLCIVILKKNVQRLGMLSSTKVEIFTQSEFEPMVFSK
jgi:hypothetical protein